MRTNKHHLLKYITSPSIELGLQQGLPSLPLLVLTLFYVCVIDVFIFEWSLLKTLHQIVFYSSDLVHSASDLIPPYMVCTTVSNAVKFGHHTPVTALTSIVLPEICLRH